MVRGEVRKVENGGRGGVGAMQHVKDSAINLLLYFSAGYPQRPMGAPNFNAPHNVGVMGNTGGYSSGGMPGGPYTQPRMVPGGQAGGMAPQGMIRTPAGFRPPMPRMGEWGGREREGGRGRRGD